jgi:hypothetical protein
VYIATVLDPRNKLDKCFPAGDAMTVAEVKALYTAELMNIAQHHAPEMLVTPDPLPPVAQQQPRHATSTTAPGALNLYADSSDDENVPIADQVRDEQERSDTRSLATKESERFFALRARYGTTYRRDTSSRAMEFFDKNMKDLYLHRLLDTRTRSAKVDEVSCERDFGMSGRIFGPLRESTWPPMLVRSWCLFH